MLTKKDQTDFKIVFDGDLHQVDANTLINSLFHITAIIQEFNNEINREFSTNKKIETKINAFSEGSFEVHLEIISGFSEAISELLTSQNIQTTAAIIAGLVGVLQLKRFLKGKEPKNVEKKGDTVTIEGENNARITIDKRTYNIYNHNTVVNESISKNFETLDNDPSISAFEISGNKEINIPKEEFHDLARHNLLLEESQNIEIDHEAKLNIVKVVFEENYKWQFYYKGNKISANISDKKFYNRIDDGERFSKGDILICELQINKIFDKTANTYVNKSYQINNVQQHIPRGGQEKIDFE